MHLVVLRFKSFFRFNFIILLLFINSLVCFSQQKRNIDFIWTDNSLKTFYNPHIYLITQSKDTIFPVSKADKDNDTISFEAINYKNPVYLELSADSNRKKSNKFHIISLQSYRVTELNDSLVVKAQPLTFSSLETKAQLLYTFLIKLFIELLVAIPVAALLRLPARLLFFVFVANIMSFPLVYVSFLSGDMKEVISIILEAFFIFLIGWKRLKFWKALLVSVLLNTIRFGIYKVVMLVISIL